MLFKQMKFLIIILIIIISTNTLNAEESSIINIPELIREFSSDWRDLNRYYNIWYSPERNQQMDKYLNKWIEKIKGINFESLNQDEKIDIILLLNKINYLKYYLGSNNEQYYKVEYMVPFANIVTELVGERRDMSEIDLKGSAEKLNSINESIEKITDSVKKSLNKKESEEKKLEIDKNNIHFIIEIINTVNRILKDWFSYYNKFDPQFSWWIEEPFTKTKDSLEAYKKLIQNKILEIKKDDEENDKNLFGKSIGRNALLKELQFEMIAYTPEELIEIGEKEMKWCENELKKAAAELGKKDWHEALDFVKCQYVEPGKQDDLIKELAYDAINFIENNDLITIPEICKNTWFIGMIDEKVQKNIPFASYGGQRMNVAFATREMNYNDKLMSMRANNRHSMRIVTAHELIPGHHLQSFIAKRHKQYRSFFSTPFYGEGWALYWEIQLWDKGYIKSPEDRIGTLFWRIHRCARIIVSLKFHLGNMTPDEMVNFLIERVGHEKSTAIAEVRRYIKGHYSALYQCAYMVGGLQIRTLYNNFVKTGKISEKKFHNTILKQNSVPIEMLYLKLNVKSPELEYKPAWKFIE